MDYVYVLHVWDGDPNRSPPPGLIATRVYLTFEDAVADARRTVGPEALAETDRSPLREFSASVYDPNELGDAVFATVDQRNVLLEGC